MADYLNEWRYFLNYNINISIIEHFKQYLPSVIQSAMFTGRVARQINRLFVLRMTVKLAYTLTSYLFDVVYTVSSVQYSLGDPEVACVTGGPLEFFKGVDHLNIKGWVGTFFKKSTCSTQRSISSKFQIGTNSCLVYQWKNKILALTKASNPRASPSKVKWSAPEWGLRRIRMWGSGRARWAEKCIQLFQKRLS